MEKDGILLVTCSLSPEEMPELGERLCRWRLVLPEDLQEVLKTTSACEGKIVVLVSQDAQGLTIGGGVADLNCTAGEAVLQAGEVVLRAGEDAMQAGEVVLWDEEVALRDGKCPCILGFGEDYHGPARYVALDLDAVTDDFLDMVFARHKGLPLTILTTERLCVREMTEEDLPLLYELYGYEHMTDFVEPLYEYEKELEFTRAYIKNMYGFFGYGLWLVFRRNDGKLVGRMGLENCDVPGCVDRLENCDASECVERLENCDAPEGVDRLENCVVPECIDRAENHDVSECGCSTEDTAVELGVMIGTPFQDMGYAGECCAAAIKWAFDDGHLGLGRLFFRTRPENKKSVHLAISLGFERIAGGTDGLDIYCLERSQP